MFLKIITIFLFCYLEIANADFSPYAEGVEPGKVLLPTTRRGKYLANVIRRQAVDGTGIRFNKYADRLNAESKKKIDILDDEFIPHVITEQERRVDIYYKMMNAIKTGYKGVTIAEFRNRPGLIIRNGEFYRCPLGSKVEEPKINDEGLPKRCMNEQRSPPVKIPMDSCAASEDALLYRSRDDYFFCNRKGLPGESQDPNDPTNITLVACEPNKRTLYNWTVVNCGVMNTLDVMVQYRYYPDPMRRSEIRKIDPQHEICDNWMPCRVGYMWSLPYFDDAISVLDYEEIPKEATTTLETTTASGNGSNGSNGTTPPANTTTTTTTAGPGPG